MITRLKGQPLLGFSVIGALDSHFGAGTLWLGKRVFASCRLCIGELSTDIHDILHINW